MLLLFSDGCQTSTRENITEIKQRNVQEYIDSGKDKEIIDPDPQHLYTKRKRRLDALQKDFSKTTPTNKTNINYPSTG